MATQPKPVVPSLHSISTPMLTKKEDVAAYLIQFLFANPGGTSTMNEGEMMSFRKLVAQYGDQDTDTLSSCIGTMLTTSINHYFPDEQLSATCTIEKEDGYSNGIYQGNYGVVIAIRDADGNPVIPVSKLSVAKDGSSFRMIA